MGAYIPGQQYSFLNGNYPSSGRADTRYYGVNRSMTQNLGAAQTRLHESATLSSGRTSSGILRPHQDGREASRSGAGLTDHQPTYPSRTQVPHYHQQGVDNAAASGATYQFRKHAFRSLFNIFGPIVVVLFYAFTVFHYLRRPAVNGIIPDRIVDGKTVFYTWMIVAIFMLDWAKSALAGFEAAAVMQKALKPSGARQLL
ncbi:hypothetical protein PG996_002874 [Apiospora saccharicola]|uniref:Uncharacterized protein n=1 Tax=Apiospora saccharicola TaxID=335842 RepID=A0ABR1WQ03_9PEZI